MIARYMRTGLTTLTAAVAASLLLAGCAETPAQNAAPQGTTGTTGPLSGTVTTDGSSTVMPISKAMADAFMKANSGVKVAVQESGTGGGFKKFCAGQLDVAAASRPINQAEIDACKASNIDFLELPIAFDSLTVVVNKANSFVDCLTVPELKKLWEPAAEKKVTKWNQVRASFPAQPIALYGPGTASGTFDYFTLAVVGTQSSSRKDYTPSEDDQVLVDGVAKEANALGYFGYAYYAANKDKLKLVQVDGGKGCVAPSAETVQNNTYQPLSRPLFIYVSKTADARPEVGAFARFYVAPENAHFTKEIGYVPLSDATLLSVSRRLEENLVGSIFGGRGSVLGITADTFADEDKIKSALVR
jgi:phosphate transport system substrate-binding protein